MLIVDSRILLHLSFFRFFGMLSKFFENIIKETAIFFLLVIVVAAGFLQGFFAYASSFNMFDFSLNPAEENGEVLRRLLHHMTQAFLSSPDFEFYENWKPPFGILLFYFYCAFVSICMCWTLSF